MADFVNMLKTMLESENYVIGKGSGKTLEVWVGGKDFEKAWPHLPKKAKVMEKKEAGQTAKNLGFVDDGCKLFPVSYFTDED